MNSKPDKNLIGAAGEHLVLSRLLSRGYLAAQVPRGTALVDIIVNHLDGKPACLIQVKTKTSSAKGWLLSAKNESLVSNDTFYCFVDFAPEPPKVYVIPAATVSREIKRGHQQWLETPGKGDKKHNDSTMRKIDPNPKNGKDGWMDEYLERWDLIVASKIGARRDPS